MQITSNEPLASRTTLGVGGPARRFVRATSLEDVREALAAAAADGDPVLVLGGGSNLVVRDGGWDGLVLQLGVPGIAVEDHGDHARVRVGAGVPWDELVAELVAARLVGVECLSGIPGLVGATPMQNVGAYGQEVADTIASVRALDRTTGEVVTIAAAACGFGYRSSVFKGSARWIIVEVELRCRRGDDSSALRYPELCRALGVAEGGHAPLAEVRRTVIALRRGKGMVVDPADPDSRSAGSFFVNPIVTAAELAALEARLPPGTSMPRFAAPAGATKLSAGWLIERAGFAKGFSNGSRAAISSKHALALVNRGGATARELLELAQDIQDGVREHLGIELVPEPVIVGVA
jgi:UDP-N-acetylmuramate dehydrogenase